jgi:hypothetical protein
MKKLPVFVALAFALSSLAAAVPGNVALDIIEKQEKAYKKNETTAVPAAILKEVSEKYPGYVISLAYAAEDASDYKLEVGNDTKVATLYYSASGEFVKEEKKS